MKKTMKTTVLYDAIFPIWLLWIFPITWLVVLPANFLIDLVVLVLAMVYFKIPNRKYQAKKSILRIWLCGFAADFIGAYFVYLFNYKFCLKKTELTQEQRKKVALAMAVFTAPYTFYLPSDIIYNYLDALCFHIV